jgi:hypothetical protein
MRPLKSSVSPTERLFVRLSPWQTILSVVGVFIAEIALYAALVESADSCSGAAVCSNVRQ